MNDSVQPDRPKTNRKYRLISKQQPDQDNHRFTFSIKGEHSLGTGFFISPNGYAITCKHVLENDGNYIAVFNDGSEYPIGIISCK